MSAHTPEAKAFDPAILASLTTGIMLVEDGFSKIHEVAEWVVGYPVWTHELASKELWAQMSAAVLSQFPDMPTDVTLLAKVNWQKLADDIRARYGESVSVVRGNSTREKDPITTLVEAAGPDKSIIAIVGGSQP